MIGFGQGTIGHNIRDSEFAAGLQHTERFGEDLGFIRRKVDHAVRDDDIHTVGFDRQIFEIALAKFHILDVQALRTGPGALDHFGSHVHADHVSRLADFFRGEETIESRARAEVEDGLSRFERGERDRVAAPVADGGFALGQSGKQICRVEIAVGAAAVGGRRPEP